MSDEGNHLLQQWRYSLESAYRCYLEHTCPSQMDVSIKYETMKRLVQQIDEEVIWRSEVCRNTVLPSSKDEHNELYKSIFFSKDQT